MSKLSSNSIKKVKRDAVIYTRVPAEVKNKINETLKKYGMTLQQFMIDVVDESIIKLVNKKK